MISTPRLKYYLNIKEVNSGEIIVYSESSASLVSDKLCVSILQQITNTKTSSYQILAEHSNSYHPQEVISTINALEKKGFITECNNSFSSEIGGYWEELGYDLDLLAQRLQQQSVSVSSIISTSESIDISTYKNALIEQGINICDNSNSNIDLYICNDYTNESISAINLKHLKSGKPWVLVNPFGAEIWLGPLLVPQTSSCWCCLNHRLSLNNPRNIVKNLSHDPIINTPLISNSASHTIAAQMMALKLVEYLYGKEGSDYINHIITFNTQSFLSKQHKITKRPQCEHCGTSEIRFPNTIQLKECDGKNATAMGGYREVCPSETYEKFKHHVSPITGVVSELSPYQKKKTSQESSLIHNFSSGPNMALKSKSMFWLNQHLRSASGGKGKTKEQARTGALCEAIERYSMVYNGNVYEVENSFEGLGQEAISLKECLLFSNSQYSDRERNNALSSSFYSLTPRIFNEQETMMWTTVYSLSQKAFKYLPSCFCFAQYPAEDESQLYAYPDSNGCAAGNSIDEAILQGFLELVERDAAAIWWYNKIPRAEVSFDKIDNPYIHKIFKYYQSIGRSLKVLDITTDLNIPVFVAISGLIDAQEGNQIIYAFGAHVDSYIALERAIVELNQLLPLVIENTELNDKSLVKWLYHETFENNPHFIPKKSTKIDITLKYPNIGNQSVRKAIDYCLYSAAKCNIEVYVLDLTQKDVGLSVVRVIAPGMRHFWRRLGPGRLYDVPVKMGWLEHPLKEDELNINSIVI